MRRCVAGEADPEVRAAVLTGTGDRAFCAGMDLRAFASGGFDLDDDENTDAYVRLLRGRIEIPVIGAANGTAVAGGLELLLGCDLIVVAAGAKLGVPEVQRGLVAAGGGVFIANRVPLSIALELTLTGEPIDAERAAAIGLANAVVPADEVLGRRARLRGSHRRQRPARRARHEGAGPPRRRRSRRRVDAGSRELQPTIFGERGRHRRGACVRGEARPGVARSMTMRAAVCREYGLPEVVTVETVDAPEPAPGQVRVDVDAAAVNFPDVLLVAGEYQIKVPPPFVPGSEFAGVVAELGGGVDDLAVGDRVFGSAMIGAFAEQIVAPTGSLTRVPDGVDVRHRGRVRRRAPHRVQRVALGGDRRRGRRGDRARRRRWRGVGDGAARHRARRAA